MRLIAEMNRMIRSILPWAYHVEIQGKPPATPEPGEQNIADQAIPPLSSSVKSCRRREVP